MQRYRWWLSLVILAVLATAGLAVGPRPQERLASAASPLLPTPDQGPAGTLVHLSASGLPPRALVTFSWNTAAGRYRTDVNPGGVVFHGYAYDPVKFVLGQAFADAEGKVAVSFKVPEDIAGPHRISAAVGSNDVAQGLFHYLRSATMTPLSGPVGTPIEVTVYGLGPAPWNADALSWDNHFLGFISAITTHGTARVRIRATGPPGPHTIAINTASNSTPFLNSQQGPGMLMLRIVSHRSWTFTVTPGAVLPPVQVEWPPADRVARLAPDAPRTTAPVTKPAPGMSLVLSSASGIVGSRVDVRATGLQPQDQIQIVWATAAASSFGRTAQTTLGHAGSGGTAGRGVDPASSSVSTRPLFAAVAASDGTLSGQFAVPHDLGGWHTIQLVRRGEVLAYAPYFVKRNLVAVTPTRVRTGQEFTVELTGIGWTELDNGYAITYDNAYAGYACGYNARGDVRFTLTADGGPGVHLIDLYPMIYQGHGEPPWSYQVPLLTGLADAPGLALGYFLPIYRLAIVVTR
jgi:hypothetical protein